ncbi:MAG: FkbM family methyltransferase [Ferruginibacter sp.]
MRSFTRITNKFFLYLYYLVRFKSRTVAYYFAHYNLRLLQAAKVSSRGDKLLFQHTGNEILKTCVKNYINEYEKLVICLCDSRVKVSEATADNFTVEVDGIRLTVNSTSNLVTLYEIYIETLYNLSLPGSNDLVVMDVGMNVAYAALFFANNPAVKKVYSYEPFPGTYNEAEVNVAKNAGLAAKMLRHNFGISDYDGFIEVPQMTSGDGGASTNKEILEMQNHQGMPSVKVEIKSFTSEVEKIISENPGSELILKIDCEGEEYAIFESIKNNSTIFNAAKVLIIEWHLKGAGSILDVLEQHRYKTLCLPKADNQSGMLYAFK